jgi:cystine transport system substrate-binding protein
MNCYNKILNEVNKMKKRNILLTIAAVVLALGLTACSSNSQQTAEKNQLEKVKEAGVLKIGTEGTYAPFTFHDKDGTLTGFDVEIAQEVAKRIGVKAEFVETPWDGIFAGLDSKRFDVVVNEVTINPDRVAKYDFSQPYIISKAVLVVSKDNNYIKTFEDLKGKKSGQSLTSNFGKLAESYGATVIQGDGFNQAIDLLTSKRIDATINDSLSYLDYVKQQPDSDIKVVAEQNTKDEQAILFNKGNKELVDAVNKALTDMKNDGTYLKISEKYFGQDVSK